MKTLLFIFFVTFHFVSQAGDQNELLEFEEALQLRMEARGLLNGAKESLRAIKNKKLSLEKKEEMIKKAIRQSETAVKKAEQALEKNKIALRKAEELSEEYQSNRELAFDKKRRAFRTEDWDKRHLAGIALKQASLLLEEHKRMINSIHRQEKVIALDIEVKARVALKQAQALSSFKVMSSSCHKAFSM